LSFQAYEPGGWIVVLIFLPQQLLIFIRPLRFLVYFIFYERDRGFIFFG